MAPNYCASLGALYQSTATPYWCQTLSGALSSTYSTERGRGRKRQTPPPYPPPEGREIVKVDLHLHSSASLDCRVPPVEVARRCRQVGLSPIFLTDHGGIAGAQLLLEAGEPALIGQEI